MEYSSDLNEKLKYMQNTVVLFSAEYSERKPRNNSTDEKIETKQHKNFLQNGLQIKNLGTKLKRIVFINSKNTKPHNETKSGENVEKDDTLKKGRFTNFATNATLHGLNHICDLTSSRGRRGVWGVLVSIMFILYGILATSAILEYVQFDSTTKISTLFRTSMQFPSISICQQNIIPKSYTQNVPELEHWIEYEHMHTFNNMSKPEETEARAVLRRHFLASVFQASAFDFTESCVFNQEELDCAELFRPSMSETTGCYTFMDQGMIDLYGEKRTTTPGYPFGLQVWIKSNIDDYFVTSTGGAGMRLVVHDPGTVPRLSEQAVSIRPGTDVFIAIEKNENHLLSPPYSDTECVNDEGYSYELCMLECMLTYVMGSCNCSFDPRLPNPCTLEDSYFCMDSKLNDYFMHCDCLRPCKQTTYAMKQSSLQLPSPLVVKNAEKKNFTYQTKEEIQRNMIHMNVYFSSLQYTKTEQVPTFTLDELVANLGGLLGLLLGASILTMIELVEYLSMICYSLGFRGKKPQHKPS